MYTTNRRREECIDRRHKEHQSQRCHYRHDNNPRQRMTMTTIVVGRGWELRLWELVWDDSDKTNSSGCVQRRVVKNVFLSFVPFFHMIWRLCVEALARGKVQPGKKIYRTFWNQPPPRQPDFHFEQRFSA